MSYVCINSSVQLDKSRVERVYRFFYAFYLYIHFISPNIGSNDTQNIHRRTHTLTHTSIHTNNIYTHTTIYIRRGALSVCFPLSWQISVLIITIVVIIAIANSLNHLCVCEGLAVLLWNSLKSSDKVAIRPVALASTVFWSLHCGGKRIFLESQSPRPRLYLQRRRQHRRQHQQQQRGQLVRAAISLEGTSAAKIAAFTHDLVCA